MKHGGHYLHKYLLLAHWLLPFATIFFSFFRFQIVQVPSISWFQMQRRYIHKIFGNCYVIQNDNSLSLSVLGSSIDGYSWQAIGMFYSFIMEWKSKLPLHLSSFFCLKSVIEHSSPSPFTGAKWYTCCPQTNGPLISGKLSEPALFTKTYKQE